MHRKRRDINLYRKRKDINLHRKHSAVNRMHRFPIRIISSRIGNVSALPNRFNY
jgi:hypothetical protein